MTVRRYQLPRIKARAPQFFYHHFTSEEPLRTLCGPARRLCSTYEYRHAQYARAAPRAASSRSAAAQQTARRAERRRLCENVRVNRHYMRIGNPEVLVGLCYYPADCDRLRSVETGGAGPGEQSCTQLQLYLVPCMVPWDPKFSTGTAVPVRLCRHRIVLQPYM
eukprot:SAG31_NODE_6942_length_1842_cov_2.067126_1_plen_164_part_00